MLIAEYLSSPDDFRDPPPKDKESSIEATTQMAQAGNTYLSDHGLKKVDNITWERIKERPSMAFYYFAKNIGPAGALGLMAWMITKMMKVEDKFIKYTMGTLAGLILLQGTGLLQYGRNALKGEYDPESVWYDIINRKNIDRTDASRWLNNKQKMGGYTQSQRNALIPWYTMADYSVQEDGKKV